MGELEGAVSAKHLKELLARLPDDDVEVKMDSDKLHVKAKSGRGHIALEKELALPVDQVETPDKWYELDAEFCDAVSIVQACAAKDDNNYKLTCVHITPTHVEACDNFQLSRYPVETGLKSDSMIKRDSIKHVAALGMTEVCETETWVHFRNPAGLILSCRRWTEAYENLDDIISDEDGEPATLPGGLAETVKRSQVFSGDNADADVVQVRIKQGKMLIRGEGTVGRWDEQKTVKYTGPPLSFVIAPSLLVEISERTHDCKIGPTALRIDSGKFIYVTCLEQPE